LPVAVAYGLRLAIGSRFILAAVGDDWPIGIGMSDRTRRCPRLEAASTLRRYSEMRTGQLFD
jgi:hypothetical protein